MSRITVIGGTGYAGSAIVAEAASRGHRVTAVSRTAPKDPVPDVRYVQGDVTDTEVLRGVIDGADAVIAALAPRGELAEGFREATREIARQADAAGARLFVVGGYSSLRPERGAARFVEDLSDVPDHLQAEVLAGAALVMTDLPATAPTLDWVFVSPARRFGAWAPGEATGSYRLGDEVAVQPADGGEISAQDYALGVLDLVEGDDHHRAQVNLAH